MKIDPETEPFARSNELAIAPEDVSPGPSGGPVRRLDYAHGIRLYWRRLLKRPVALVGTIIFAIFLVLAVIGPYVAPYDYTEGS